MINDRKVCCTYIYNRSHVKTNSDPEERTELTRWKATNFMMLSACVSFSVSPLIFMIILFVYDQLTVWALIFCCWDSFSSCFPSSNPLHPAWYWPFFSCCSPFFSSLAVRFFYFAAATATPPYKTLGSSSWVWTTLMIIWGNTLISFVLLALFGARFSLCRRCSTKENKTL